MTEQSRRFSDLRSPTVIALIGLHGDPPEGGLHLGQRALKIFRLRRPRLESSGGDEALQDRDDRRSWSTPPRWRTPGDPSDSPLKTWAPAPQRWPENSRRPQNPPRILGTSKGPLDGPSILFSQPSEPASSDRRAA